jgi:hypothetical protein
LICFIKKKLLSIAFIREILFFIFQKKVYKKRIDKKIRQLLEGKKELSVIKIDNLIVSLTSFPERISEIKYTIYSILNQTCLPEKIILWLADSQFPKREGDLPENLLSFKEFGLEIKWCEDIKSYKKLIPALESFPEYFTLTADDDLYYNRKWIQKIWNEHIKHPNELVCHIANKIRFGKKDHILPYQKWKFNIKSGTSSFNNFPLCGGGALYHKALLFPDVTSKQLFFDLSPYADDIWFYFMAILQGTRIRVVKNPCNKVRYVNPYREYGLASDYTLTAINVGDDQNDAQFKNILNYYQMTMMQFKDRFQQ